MAVSSAVLSELPMADQMDCDLVSSASKTPSARCPRRRDPERAKPRPNGDWETERSRQQTAGKTLREEGLARQVKQRGFYEAETLAK